MELSRTGLEIGPFNLHFYGVLIVIGIVVAASIAVWLAKKDDKDPKHVWDGLLWMVIGGIIGARLWFVLFPSQDVVDAGYDTGWMLTHPFDFDNGPLAIMNGGLGIFGAVIGAGLGWFIYARRNNIKNWLEWGDILIIATPFAQAIGRWGNFLNQELYGRPSDLPWAIRIDRPPAEYPDATHFHPLFGYEALWNLILGSFLVWLWINHRQRFKPGDFLLFYMIGYGVVRFLLEFIRVETAHVPGIGINSSQLTSAVAVLIAVALLIYRHYVQKPRFHPDGRPVGKPKKQKSR
jgi:phosphatidylglycerol:prolipoprotein diacylglycerol transferase